MIELNVLLGVVVVVVACLSYFLGYVRGRIVEAKSRL